MQLVHASALVVMMIGCTSGGRVVTTQSPGVEQIPTIVGIYPLLTAEPTTAGYSHVHPLGVDAREDQIYISPPAEAKLVVTLNSQQMTDLLSGELAYRGFSLKELPVERPEYAWGSGEPAGFVVSLSLLEKLRDEYGLEAIVLGNAYFELRSHGAPARVKAVYLKLVDVATLDVLCHVSLDYDDFSADMNDAVHELAVEFARLANLPPPERASR